MSAEPNLGVTQPAPSSERTVSNEHLPTPVELIEAPQDTALPASHSRVPRALKCLATYNKKDLKES